MAQQSPKAARAKPGKSPSAAAAASAPAAPKLDGRSKPNALLGSSLAPVAAHTRRAMIAEAAYYIAARRDFADGHAMDDWLLAEKQIDAALAPGPSRQAASDG